MQKTAIIVNHRSGVILYYKNMYKKKSIDKNVCWWRGCKREQVIEDRFSQRVGNILYELHACWTNCNDNGGQYKLNKAFFSQ